MNKPFKKWLESFFIPKRDQPPLFSIGLWTVVFVGFGFWLSNAIGGLSPTIPAWTSFKVFALAGICSLALGFIVGFLFGIPRVLQGVADVPTPNAARMLSYEQRVNTNLEQISDWLTKILVGVGLVELKDAPAFIWRVGQHLSMSFSVDGSVNPAVAPAICSEVVFFAALGTLYGYLITRLFFASAFSAADQQVASLSGGKTGTLDVDAVPQNLPLEAPAASYEPTDPAKRILATLMKYQMEYFPNDDEKRWTFAISPGSPTYPEFVKGLSELLEKGLVAVSQETNQVMLSNNGLKFVKESEPLLFAGVDAYKFNE